VYNHSFEPVFTVALVGADGDELSLTRESLRWRPDRLVTEWSTRRGAVLTEVRFAQPGGRLVSSWSPRDVLSQSNALDGAHLVAFTAQPGAGTGDVAQGGAGSIRWQRALEDRHGNTLPVAAALTGAPGHRAGSERHAVAALRSEGVPRPHWRHAPFWETWRQDGGGLRDAVRVGGLNPQGVVWLAVQVPLAGAAAWPVRFTVALQPLPLAATAAPAATASDTAAAERADAADDEPAAPWLAFLDSFPRFTCSDAHLTRYYDYRLYGLRLNRLGGGVGQVRYPAVAEGIGYFHVPISYSAQCHMWETRWSTDPTLAHGSLLNFLEHQKDDGSLHGRIYAAGLHHTDFYHANWGDAVLAVSAAHDDPDFTRRAYDGLARYAAWLDEARDPEGCGMYDVVNHYETGQEYSSRYQAVHPDADVDGWEGRLRLKGIDVTVYAYRLKRALETLAARWGREEEQEGWRRGAETIGRAIQERMWDPGLGFFTDVDPVTMQRTGVKAGVGFYPLLTDLPDDGQVQRLITHLADPRTFGTPFPVPSASVDDPLFSAEGEWKGKRHNCPWNGRVWPMVNSHVIEGLLRQWHAGRRFAGSVAGRLLRRFVHMLFHEGDPARPNCYEHYHPFTGHPSVFRGIDDYQHSWVLDLLIRGVTGLEPGPTSLRIDPLPLELDAAELTRARIRGREVEVRRHGRRVVVRVDGASHATEVGTPVEIPL
jgi:hypothetical protein